MGTISSTLKVESHPHTPYISQPSTKWKTDPSAIGTRGKLLRTAEILSDKWHTSSHLYTETHHLVIAIASIL